MHLIKLTITLTIKKSSNPEDAANTDRFGCVSTPTQKLADLLMPPKIFNSALLIIPILVNVFVVLNFNNCFSLESIQTNEQLQFLIFYHANRLHNSSLQYFHLLD